MSAPGDLPARGLHRGRLVLGILMLLLAALSLLQQTGVLSVELRWVAPGLLVVAGLVLLLASAPSRARA